MSSAAPLQHLSGKPKPVTTSPHPRMRSQRQCTRVSPTSSENKECVECKSKKHLRNRLATGARNGPFEQEAARVTDRVLAEPPHVATEGLATRVQHYAGRGAPRADATPASVERVLASPGTALDLGLRRDMEQRFGNDFSQVRVHSGSTAEQSARDVNANAYTAGHNIVFGEHQYAAEMHEGRRLIAHELTHVLQQSGSAGGRPGQSNDKPSVVSVGFPILQRQEAKNPKEEPATETMAMAPQPLDSKEGPTSMPQQASSTSGDADAGATCPPKDKLDAIEKQYKDIIKKGRDKGANVAADNLEHFLDGSGTKRVLSVTWLRGFSSLTDAERVNQKRFETSLNKEANAIKHGEKKTFNDHWDRQFTAGRSEELYYASGTSTITSTGSFDLSCIENVVSIGGTVSDHWFDPYDWHAGLSAYVPGMGSVSDADALIMQNCRGAKPFDMESDWKQGLASTIKVGKLYNDTSFSWSGP